MILLFLRERVRGNLCSRVVVSALVFVIYPEGMEAMGIFLFAITIGILIVLNGQ